MTNTIDDPVFFIDGREVPNPFTRQFATALMASCGIGDWIYEVLAEAFEEYLWEKVLENYQKQVRNDSVHYQFFRKRITEARDRWRCRAFAFDARPLVVGGDDPAETEIGMVLDQIEDLMKNHVEYAKRQKNRPHKYPAVEVFVATLEMGWFNNDHRRFIASFGPAKREETRGMNECSLLVYETTRLLKDDMPKSTLKTIINRIAARRASRSVADCQLLMLA